jgi:hypothetical protein
MATLTKQNVRADWRIIEDFPSRDGQYLVCFLDDATNKYTDYDLFWFIKGEWKPGLDEVPYETPAYWIDVPSPT